MATRGAVPGPGALRPDAATLSVGAALLLVTVAAWTGVLLQARSMASAMPMEHGTAAGGLADLLGFLAAWTVMMAAMMLPSAAPLVLLHRTAGPGGGAANSLPLATGYLLVWSVFGVPVYLAQQTLGALAAASMAVADARPYAIAAALLLAGLYQFTPLKEVCLRQCRSPLDFLMQRWRRGPVGALRLGMEHGAYCVGCCWCLMAVLVGAGAMGLAWVALIALVVFAEKLLPGGRWATRLTGGVLVGLGVLVALRPELAMLLRSGGMAM